ncbi:MAG: biotin/lipoyl-binding protein [Saprospiraceae bacterium]|nr:biotin/lipoyl-binding protein [Saprospiraceae bacterium]
MPKKYSARVNDDFQFDDLSTSGLDVISIDAKHFHLLKDGKSYQAELIQLNPLQKAVTLKINGSTYQVKLQDKYDRLIQKMGLQVKAGQQLKDIKAPMPGLVLDIMVEAGQAVSTGDPLLILEAMKMENVIKAPGDGVIKEVPVQKGAAVDKGQLLVGLE